MRMVDISAARLPSFADIQRAKRRIDSEIRTTPVLSDPEFDDLLGCKLWLKCENLQRTGAFKFRGASNALARLDEAKVQGDVATHSSGNHGAALALAATIHHRRAWVVMPENSVATKIEAVRRNNGKVIFCAPTQQAREKGLAELVAKGCIPVPPYDDADIICGQGTAALEFMSQCPALDTLLAPVGGGGLISGSAIAARGVQKRISIVGAEPAGAADAALSLQLGQRVEQFEVNTIADGLRATIGVLNFAIMQKFVEEIVTVSEEGIVDAMALLWRHLHLLIEPSSATVIAAIRARPEVFSGRSVGAILSGGNVDLDCLPFKAGASVLHRD